MVHPNPPAQGWMPSRRHLIASAGAALAAPWIGAQAQGRIAGGKPITLVVSYPPGGGADLMARTIAPKLEAALGQTVVVENKAGASGQLAAESRGPRRGRWQRAAAGRVVVCGEPLAVSQAAL